VCHGSKFLFFLLVCPFHYRFLACKKRDIWYVLRGRDEKSKNLKLLDWMKFFSVSFDRISSCFFYSLQSMCCFFCQIRMMDVDVSQTLCLKFSRSFFRNLFLPFQPSRTIFMRSSIWPAFQDPCIFENGISLLMEFFLSWHR